MLEKVSWEENVRVDMLSKPSARESMEEAWIESLQDKSIPKEICRTEMIEDWTQPIKDFILEENYLMRRRK